MNNVDSGQAKVLVTGASGFIGRRLVSALVAEGVAVRCLMRHPEKAALPSGVETVTGDLLDRSSLDGAFRGLVAVVESLRGALSAAQVPPERLAAVEAAEQEADLPYLLEQVPPTIAETLEGLKRVAGIVRAMKEFAHPDQKEMVATDLNRALQATLEVARNEYKYVADVELALADLPLVTCHAGDVNQVFLNVIVNAAHAIGDVMERTGRRGLIRVESAPEGEQVRVSISDTGGGIPAEAQPHIFEPFFTTKPVGRGTGQGLAIARSVVEAHRGTIRFESRAGEGTTFHVRLPVAPPGRAA